MATLWAMKAVGIKALKNRLSEYIRLARAGEVILVTDRDEVVAEISRPRTASPGLVSQWEAFLNDEERRGRLTRARRTSSLAIERLRNDPLPEPPQDLLATLQQTREERS